MSINLPKHFKATSTPSVADESRFSFHLFLKLAKLITKDYAIISRAISTHNECRSKTSINLLKQSPMCRST